MKKEKKGVTLIALVITIIILLILAGVTLSLIVSENGLLSKTRDATEKYKKAQEDEKERLDIIPPSIPTITLKLENGEDYINGKWTNQKVKITFSSLDEGGSGITRYEYSLDGKNSAGTITPEYLVNTEGITNICIRAVDKAGNASEWTDLKTIKIDTVAPQVTLTGTVNGATNVTLNGTGTDESCNVYYQWSTSSNVPTTGWNDVGDMTTTQSFNVTTTYYFWVKDEAGNVTKRQAIVSRETTKVKYYEKCDGSLQYQGAFYEDGHQMATFRCTKCPFTVTCTHQYTYGDGKCPANVEKWKDVPGNYKVSCS